MTFLGIWSITLCNGYVGAVWVTKASVLDYITPHVQYETDEDLEFYCSQRPLIFTKLR